MLYVLIIPGKLFLICYYIAINKNRNKYSTDGRIGLQYTQHYFYKTEQFLTMEYPWLCLLGCQV